jgi:hypothetical protein
MPLKRDVIYPIFLKCICYSENDTFWKETFEELSYGICFQGSYINKGFICSNVKGKEFTYKFIDKEPEKIYNSINLGLMLKSIKNTDIIYDKGEIKEIKGISFSKGKYQIDIDIYSGLDEEVSKVSEKKEKKLLRYL